MRLTHEHPSVIATRKTLEALVGQGFLVLLVPFGSSATNRIYAHQDVSAVINEAVEYNLGDVDIFTAERVRFARFIIAEDVRS